MQFPAKFQALLSSDMRQSHVAQFVVCFAFAASDVHLRVLTLTSLSLLVQLLSNYLAINTFNHTAMFEGIFSAEATAVFPKWYQGCKNTVKYSENIIKI